MYQTSYYPAYKYNTELYHHGILGMKWGVRRYQKYGEGGYTPKDKVEHGSAINSVMVAKKMLNDIGNMPIYSETVDRLSRIPIDLQYFSSNKRKPYKYKNKQEYEIVRHAFSVDVSKEAKKEDWLTKTINVDNQGAYTYTARNESGNGDFVVYKRTKLKDGATGLMERDDYHED